DPVEGRGTEAQPPRVREHQRRRGAPRGYVQHLRSHVEPHHVSCRPDAGTEGFERASRSATDVEHAAASREVELLDRSGERRRVVRESLVPCRGARREERARFLETAHSTPSMTSVALMSTVTATPESSSSSSAASRVIAAVMVSPPDSVTLTVLITLPC